MEERDGRKSSASAEVGIIFGLHLHSPTKTLEFGSRRQSDHQVQIFFKHTQVETPELNNSNHHCYCGG